MRPKLKVWIERRWSLIASALLHAGAIAGLLIVLPHVLTPTSHSDDTRDAISIELAELPSPPIPAKPAPDVAEAAPILQSPTSEIALPPAPKKLAAVPKPKPVVAAAPVETPAPILFDAPSPFITTTTPDATQTASAMTAGRTGTPPDYLTQVYLRLARNKTYPRMAELRHQEGEVMLRFTVDRDGHVLRHIIDRSSGYTVLDREVEAMLARSDPLPPVTPEMTGTTFEIVVPVQFLLSDLGQR